jgi:hypothetical protein
MSTEAINNESMITLRRKHKITITSPSSKQQHEGSFNNNSNNIELGITPEFITSKLLELQNHLTDLICQQKNEIIDQLQNENILLKSEIVDLRADLKKKTEDIADIETDVINLQQYVRRNNIEIHGIPNNVNDKDLEEKVIELAGCIDVELKKEDIEACHRLPNNKKNSKANKRTIVRFVNRKSCDKLHIKKSEIKKRPERLREIGLASSNLYINSNLCPYNKFLWGKCKKLFNEKLIHRFWIYNGSVFLLTDENEVKTKIDHLSTLKYIFPGYNFDTNF